MIEKDFDIPFVAELALHEKQIQQNYRPIIAVHKWFARRPGTLFRSLLLSEFVEGKLQDNFFDSNDLSGIKIADPFMGGGTPLLEANRIGCDVLGYDINPMAYWIVRQEIEHLDLVSYREAANKLVNWLGKKIGHLYKTTCTICRSTNADVKWHWVSTPERRLLSLDDQPIDKPKYEVIACIGGRGFGVRREDMKKLLLATRGKVFTIKTLNRLIDCTQLNNYRTR